MILATEALVCSNGSAVITSFPTSTTVHNGLNCYTEYHPASPQAFLLGKSSYVKEADLPAVLLHKLRALSKHSRTKEENDNNILHKLFVVTWDSQLKEVAKSSHRFKEP